LPVNVLQTWQAGRIAGRHDAHATIAAARLGMNFIALLFGIASLVCGLVAAAQWYRASRIVVEPNLFELSDDVHEADFNWELIRAIMMAGRQTSTLNKIAALWTAAAVLLGGATSLLTTLTLR
jgi:hypothetical protein